MLMKSPVRTEAGGDPIAAAFAREQWSGLAYALWGRGLAWLGWTIGFMPLEVAILTYMLIVPPPFIAEAWTPQINLRLPNFLFLGVFPIGMALS
ncbi:MAG: hypothetical protein O7H40_12800 [Gammaproteobacteria bacterium]|nr:hypothetical protein [Gammaproteobacteria bacterium]